MELRLRSVLDIAQVLGGKEQLVAVGDQADVAALLTHLLAKHGEALEVLLLQSREAMSLLPQVKVYVNGRGIDFLDGLRTVLQPGDDVLIMPQLSGG